MGRSTKAKGIYSGGGGGGGCIFTKIYMEKEDFQNLTVLDNCVMID